MSKRKGYLLVVKYAGAEQGIAAFRTKKYAEYWGRSKFPVGVNHWRVLPMTWGEAVKTVRLFIFRRDDYTCVRCGKSVTWESGQMDEKLDRGKGGEVSIFNCRTMCSDCHIGSRGKHGGRAPKFTRTRI